MKFTQEINQDSFTISAYSDDEIAVNGEPHQRSFMIVPDKVIPNWGVKTFEQLELNNLTAIDEHEIDIVLLSTGQKHRIPDMRIMAHYLERGIGCEVMTTAAVCRTYNLLASEDRRVAATFIIEPG